MSRNKRTKTCAFRIIVVSLHQKKKQKENKLNPKTRKGREIMKTTANNVYVLKISLMNEDGSYDYVKVAGVYTNREDAWNKAQEKMDRMKLEWNNYQVKKHNNDSFYIKSETGLAKWYEVIEMPLR